MKSLIFLLFFTLFTLGSGTSQARYLNTDAGRFTTMDTFPGDEQEPMSLHKYVYAEDDPIDHIDPSGHDIGDLVTAMDVVGTVLEAFGFTAVGDALASAERPSRSLTPGETQLASSIFGGKINYTKVRIVLGSWAPVQAYDRPMTPDGNIYISSATGSHGSAYSSDYSKQAILGQKLVYSQSDFIHEMTHVWQYQSGMWVKTDWVMQRDWRDSSYDYDFSTFGTIDFKKYGIEQQAMITQDFYLLLHSATIYRNGGAVQHPPPLQSYQVVTGKYFP